MINDCLYEAIVGRIQQMAIPNQEAVVVLNIWATCKAASQAITSKKLDKFHETGLFGSVCGSHDVLPHFCNIYISGEN